MENVPLSLIRICQDENGNHKTLQHLVDGKISNIEVYKMQVNEWYFKPIKILAEQKVNYNMGISMFILELVFFEAHGQYLQGKESKGRSEEAFKEGFKRLLTYLIENKKLNKSAINIIDAKLYHKIRCGLFHSGFIKNGFLVDSLAKNEKDGEPFYRGEYDGWLVNPWCLIKCLKDYFDDYIKELKEGTNQTLKCNFDKMFDEFHKDFLTPNPPTK